jgi:UDP-N-acetylmuramate dehydrogenase
MIEVPSQYGVLLAPLTTWRVGGACRVLAEPRTPEELTAARREAVDNGWPVFLLGGGSNILVADDGYPGMVIRYAARSTTVTAVGNDTILHAEARAPLAGTARAMARAGLAGLEWAEGIPGTIAGAVVGNAGAYGSDIASRLVAVDLVHPDGTAETWAASRMEYGYRSSCLKGMDPAGPAIVAARVRLEKGDPTLLQAEVARISAERRAKTPIGASCGSVFRNPPGASAGRWIEQAGCKGMRRGAAVVSTLHANYIINEGGATAREILSLIDGVRERVRAGGGPDLILEIQLVGFGAV